jgi:hypothetical protein
LQGGVHLNSKTLDHEQPLACAYRLWQMRHYAPTVEVDPTPLAHAQYELLKAVSERKLDPHYVYEIGAYEAMGISHRSAKLIQKATQEVNEVFVQCVLDDWKFEHPGQNITEFLLNRELGAAGRGRR